MTKRPICGTGSGFASACRRTPTHVETMRRYATPVIRDKEREAELAASAYLAYRSPSELYRGNSDSNRGADRSLSPIWFARELTRYWGNRLDFYRDLYCSFLPFKKIV